jgi:hypothetical protein
VLQATLKVVGRVILASETGDSSALSDLLKTDAWGALTEVARSLQAASKSSVLAERILINSSIDNYLRTSQSLHLLWAAMGSKRSRNTCWMKSTEQEAVWPALLHQQKRVVPKLALTARSRTRRPITTASCVVYLSQAEAQDSIF